MLCPFKVNSNTIKLTVHTYCYCVSDLICFISPVSNYYALGLMYLCHKMTNLLPPFKWGHLCMFSKKICICKIVLSTVLLCRKWTIKITCDLFCNVIAKIKFPLYLVIQFILLQPSALIRSALLVWPRPASLAAQPVSWLGLPHRDAVGKWLKTRKKDSWSKTKENDNQPKNIIIYQRSYFRMMPV